MMSKINVSKFAMFAAVAIIIIWAFINLISPGQTQATYQVAEAKTGSFPVTVNTIGSLDAARSYVVSSTIKGEYGKIVYIADEGTLIKKGDVLVQFDSAYFESQILRLTGELKGFEASYEARKQILEWEKSQAEGSIKSAEFDLTDAKQEYNRYASYINDLEELGKKGLKYPNEISQAKKKAEQLYAKQQKCATVFEQINKESVFKIAAAAAELSKVQNEIETTKTSLDDMKAELGKAIVYAPYQGIVVHYEAQRDNQKRKPRAGDTVWQNQPLLYLPDISSLLVKTLVREVDLYKISKGQKVSIKIDAYPKLSLSGRVSSIGVMASDEASSGNGEKYFQVIVSVDGENLDLRPGMTAKVVIDVDHANNVLTVPVQSVFNEYADKYCYVAKNQKMRKVKVETGRQNEDLLEITEGLNNGDLVSLTKPSDDEVR